MLLNIAMFDSRAHYEANARDPEQDQWYQRMVQYCAEPPEWHDHTGLLAHEFTPPAS